MKTLFFIDNHLSPIDKDLLEAQKQDVGLSEILRWLELGELPSNDVRATWIVNNTSQYSVDNATGVLMKVGKPDNFGSVTYRRCVPKRWR